MDDLITFLRAQIDLDAVVALAVPDEDRHWRYTPGGETVSSEHGTHIACGPWNSVVDEHAATHIARHDPARVLRDVGVKRGMVDFAETVIRNEQQIYERTSGDHQAYMLRSLAMAYNDQPGYRATWAV